MLKLAKISAVLLLLIYCFELTPALSQVEMDVSQVSPTPPCLIDFAAFRQGNSEKVRLEVYYKIFNDHLSFVKKAELFVADYEIQAKVLGKNNRQISGNTISEEFEVPFYKETVSPANFLINQLDLEVPVGQYKLEITFTDKHSNQTATLNFPLKIRDYRKKSFDLSDLEFTHTVSDTASGSKFDKLGKRIIPKVEPLFAGEDQKLWFYYEIYRNRPNPVLVEVTYEIIDYLHNPVHLENEELKLGQISLSQIKTLDLNKLSPNRYTLLIKLKEKGGSQVSLEKDFQIDWSPLFYVKNDFKTAVEHLRYIANEEETKQLKKAPPEEQVKKWEEFWDSKDPVPETEVNELKEQYYERLKYANLNFRTYSKEGWKTDLGMVYVKYGRPDEVDRHPFEREKKTYQIWHYYELRKVFTFVDEVGNGEYELQYPYDGDVRKLRR
ncbi:MAG: hypothetical protein A2145_04480 [candidate division Zixibacteria bacterium RBG_16_40_9]|nr:MAG: hypothetical protein A2145_04480 [candidate division Zixibacteria bacterium RBG_16_40_9]